MHINNQAIKGFKLRMYWYWWILSATITVTSWVIPARSKSAWSVFSFWVLRFAIFATIFEMVDWIFNIYTDLVSIFPLFRATFYARIGTERNKSITKSNVFEDRKSNKKSCLKRVNLEPSGTASKSQKSRSSWEYSRNASRSVSVGIEKIRWSRSALSIG